MWMDGKIVHSFLDIGKVVLYPPSGYNNKLLLDTLVGFKIVNFYLHVDH